MSRPKTLILILSLIAVLALPSVSAAHGPTAPTVWHFGSDHVMVRLPHTTSNTLNVLIPAGTSQTWVSDEVATLREELGGAAHWFNLTLHVVEGTTVKATVGLSNPDGSFVPCGSTQEVTFPTTLSAPALPAVEDARSINAKLEFKPATCEIQVGQRVAVQLQAVNGDLELSMRNHVGAHPGPAPRVRTQLTHEPGPPAFPTPELPTLALAGIGLVGLALVARRFR